MVKLTKDPKSKLTEENVKDIFCNIVDIQSVSSEILRKSEAAFEEFPKTPIGAIFQQKVEKRRKKKKEKEKEEPKNEE